MKVWELNITDIDCTSFYLPEESKIERFQESIENMQHNEFLREDWVELVLLKSEQKNDPDFFDLLDLGIAIVNSKVQKILDDIFPDKSDYELFPFLNDEDSYYLFKLNKFTDCLQKEESIFDALPSGQILTYESLVFNNEMIEKKPIFKIPELPYTSFVTHAFKYYYDEARLKGIDFDDENVVFID